MKWFVVGTPKRQKGEPEPEPVTISGPWHSKGLANRELRAYNGDLHRVHVEPRDVDSPTPTPQPEA